MFGVLQAFIDARYKNGKSLTDDEITGMLIAVLFAGQHTSSITSTWTGLYMLAYKSMVMPDALDEQRKVRPSIPPEISRLSVCVCVYVRRQRKHTRVHLLRRLLRAKGFFFSQTRAK